MSFGTHHGETPTSTRILIALSGGLVDEKGSGTRSTAASKMYPVVIDAQVCLCPVTPQKSQCFGITPEPGGCHETLIEAFYGSLTLSITDRLCTGDEKWPEEIVVKVAPFRFRDRLKLEEQGVS